MTWATMVKIKYKAATIRG